MSLKGKQVVLGVTGGIAIYKSVELVSRLVKQGIDVHVIMTKNATEFVTPLTFETMSRNPVALDTFARPDHWEVEHIALAQRAQVFAIAPATANILAKMAHGLADDMLSTTVLATKAPVLVAPAMNTGMWTAQATQENIARLRNRGVHFVGPASGALACGDTGAGRMSEPEEICEAICSLLCPKQDFAGLKVMITAGATRERLDPVRYLTNDSSGKMGFALAEVAAARGAEVTLVCGATTAPAPAGIPILRVESTQELYNAVTSRAPEMDVIIQAAAPADYRFAAAVGQHKHPGQTLVGFAAETQHVLENARKKLQHKHLDLIVANDVTRPGAGFNVDTNIATIISADGAVEYPLRTKRQLADDILDAITDIRAKQA